MKIIVAKTEREFDETAAQLAAQQLIKKPDSVMGFATGNTTIGFHRELSRLTQSLHLDWSQATSVNLDEFIGPRPDNPRSCHYRMYEQLLNQTNILPENILIPSSDEKLLEQTLHTFPEEIRRRGGGVFQVLGIGTNGHIAMNEPGTPWGQDMLTVTLSEKTVGDKAAFWGGADQVPRRGVTMGMRLILQGRTQLLMAKGADKADAIYKTLCGPVTEQVASSALQLHPNVIVLLDEAAAAKLS